jgi:glycosyltransferase involved in cell wall biosynthesis
VDARRFQPRRDLDLRRALGVADDQLLFGFVGHLREEKNLPLLLRAFAKAHMENARLLLLGDGACRSGLEYLAQDLGIRHRVIFQGHAEDTTPYYAAFDAFVMSSATEQMPMALLEAMACGLPAVCTSAGDTEAMLGEPAVPPGDLASYALALRCMAGGADRRAALGARNRQRAVDLYSFDRMVEEYANLYRSALHPKE